MESKRDVGRSELAVGNLSVIELHDLRNSGHFISERSTQSRVSLAGVFGQAFAGGLGMGAFT